MKRPTSDAPAARSHAATYAKAFDGRYIAYDRTMTGMPRRRYCGSDVKSLDSRLFALVWMVTFSKDRPTRPPWMIVSRVYVKRLWTKRTSAARRLMARKPLVASATRVPDARRTTLDPQRWSMRLTAEKCAM